MATIEDIVVIGAGIVGAACAARLVMAGKKVVILDRVPPGTSCSFGNAGGLSPTVCLPLATPSMYSQIPGWLMRRDGPLAIDPKYLLTALPWLLRFMWAGLPSRSRIAAKGMYSLMHRLFDDYEPLLEFAGAQSLIHRVGQLYVFSTESGFAKEQAAIKVREALGFEQKLLLGISDIREYEPELDDRFTNGVYLPGNGHCSNAHRLVELLVEASVRSGARFVAGNVTRLEPAGTLVRVHGLSETLHARHVVLAGGIWSNELLKSLSYRVPLESHRGYHIHAPCEFVRPRRNVVWAEMKVVATPMDSGVRIAGTAEIAGLKAPPREARYALLEDTARRMYPRLDVTGASRWMGHRPCTPDSLPVIGPLPRERRIICALGHGHIGLSAASFTGRVVAQIVADNDVRNEWAPFSIERFL
ncbi:FAD-binding oxidoreductase [Bradyrhizobium arachidis]|uniref:NAD(P)/FAD-dependent oxidoreductase n=1 Tax=Bradyrhizobium arachidis TaxID=858423 RepID=UPI002163A924|nr:FAD-dependent oxidoreductase [Bradyrhizobium arachidis]UVO30442.1 FAD-dependent oxidoreductase [Bradyrhizobium arachidis]